MVSFVKELTVRAWCTAIAPRLLWMRLRRQGRGDRCYVFEGSRLALAVARTSGRVIGVRVEPLRFHLIDVRDEQGLWLRTRIIYHDLATVHAQMMEDPVFREAIDQVRTQGRLPTYLAKALTPTGFSARGALWRVLLAVQLCVWWLNREAQSQRSTLLFMERRPWFDIIARYASNNRVEVIPTPALFDLRAWLRRHISLALRRRIRQVKAWWHRRGRPSRRKTSGGSSQVPGWPPQAGELAGQRARAPRLAVDYYGHLNLAHPECYSDLFFWQQSSLASRDLLLCFQLPKDPLDEIKLAQLAEHGIEPVVLHPMASTLPDASVFTYHPQIHARPRAPARFRASQRTPEAAWVQEHLRDYHRLAHDWEGFFAAYGIKLYVTWFKYDREHCAMADALQGLGGLTAMYQRAYESHPSPPTMVSTDVFFGFSQAAAEVERRSGSVIPYDVTTGYLGDHRFALLRQGSAARLRERLQQHGARRILALADESTVDFSPWYPDHEYMRGYYAGLLEKVLEESWLGLIIKPKSPATLRSRLGPVAELLRRAEATGRCVIFEGGTVHGSHPSALAALASDVMIQAHLFAATAGIESALAGVPTLLVDGEGWSPSPLARLGAGRVIFRDWRELWQACVDHWAAPGGMPGFGEWSGMLDELDPFRDGRAAQRMGTYLQWLLEGFKAGLPRHTVLADAAERYASLWGRDKIVHVNARPIGAVQEAVQAEAAVR